MSSKKGISSIIGTLIFIGILFSAIAPMFLVMRQSDVFYEISKQEIELEEDNKQREQLVVYGYGSEGTTNIYVHVQNRGIVPVEVERVWFNDEYHTDPAQISPLEAVTLGPYDMTDTGSEIMLRVVTSTGNIFTSDLGKLYWDAVNGWYTPSLGISLHILNDKGKYHVLIKNHDNAVIEDYTSIDIEWDDIDKTILIGQSDSPCTVTVEKKETTGWSTLLNELEVIVPNAGNYIVHVVVDGR